MAILAGGDLTSIKPARGAFGYKAHMFFRDRIDAGQRLAKALVRYKHAPDAIVLALPRGGVPVAYEIAKSTSLPLDVMLVRKLGVPGQRELAMGAIADGGVRVLNDDIVDALRIPSGVIAEIIAEERTELERRSRAYRQGNPPPKLEARTVILVDDGSATGANMKAAIEAAAKQRAGRIIAALPVASDSAYEVLRKVADEVVCLDIPEPFYGVGAFYGDFSQTSDAEVTTFLKEARHLASARENHHA